MTYIHHYSIIQNRSTALKILCALPSHSSLSPNSWKPLIFHYLQSFAFSRMSDTWNHTGFSDRPLSLSNMHLKFVHIFSWFDSSFLFFFFNFLNFYLFYFCLCWVFAGVPRLSLFAASGGYSSLWCVGFSLRWLLLLRSTGSRHAGFSSCGTQA